MANLENIAVVVGDISFAVPFRGKIEKVDELEDQMYRITVKIFMRIYNQQIEIATSEFCVDHDTFKTLNGSTMSRRSIRNSISDTISYDMTDMIAEKILGKTLAELDTHVNDSFDSEDDDHSK
jgi:hypothetical protein